MTLQEWIGIITSVILAATTIWKAIQAKDYKTALHATTDGIEDITKHLKDAGDKPAAKAITNAVTARAEAADIEPFLSAVVHRDAPK